MRFLFTTLQFRESEFYGRVAEHLIRRGHEAAHVTFSRHAARALGRHGLPAVCLPTLMADLPPFQLQREVARLEARYDIASLRDVYRTDPPCAGRAEAWCAERTVRQFLALERAFDQLRPDVVIPEVGSETMRTAAHAIGLDRKSTVFFLFYTIFPRPLRLYANTMHAPIVPREALRGLTVDERVEVQAFIDEFTARGTPIRAHRVPSVNPRSLRDFARHVAVSSIDDRDNEYLRPRRFVTNFAREKSAAAVARRLYEPIPRERPFIYFPLHVTDDYKIKRVIPHCVHQDALIEQVAEALPQGIDLVLKEHPMSIGRNPIRMLRRLVQLPNVRLVEPYTSSHELIQRARATVVISSTIGLEALLYAQPVMTLGQPFYSGFGLTVDVDSFREVSDKLGELLAFQPDREQTLRFLHAAMRACYPGKPALVDDSDENALALAESLDTATRALRDRRAITL